MPAAIVEKTFTSKREFRCCGSCASARRFCKTLVISDGFSIKPAYMCSVH